MPRFATFAFFSDFVFHFDFMLLFYLSLFYKCLVFCFSNSLQNYFIKVNIA
jgi:hypothetical protein